MSAKTGRKGTSSRRAAQTIICRSPPPPNCMPPRMIRVCPPAPGRGPLVPGLRPCSSTRAHARRRRVGTGQAAERRRSHAFREERAVSSAPFDAATLETLISAAMASPSLHNTQPWRYGRDHDALTLLIRAGPERVPPRTDPAGRALLLSVGAAVLNLRVAASHLGWRPVVRLLPDAAAPRCWRPYGWPERRARARCCARICTRRAGDATAAASPSPGAPSLRTSSMSWPSRPTAKGRCWSTPEFGSGAACSPSPPRPGTATGRTPTDATRAADGLTHTTAWASRQRCWARRTHGGDCPARLHRRPPGRAPAQPGLRTRPRPRPVEHRTRPPRRLAAHRAGAAERPPGGHRAPTPLLAPAPGPGLGQPALGAGRRPPGRPPHDTRRCSYASARGPQARRRPGWLPGRCWNPRGWNPRCWSPGRGRRSDTASVTDTAARPDSGGPVGDVPEPAVARRSVGTVQALFGEGPHPRRRGRQLPRLGSPAAFPLKFSVLKVGAGPWIVSGAIPRCRGSQPG